MMIFLTYLKSALSDFLSIDISGLVGWLPKFNFFLDFSLPHFDYWIYQIYFFFYFYVIFIYKNKQFSRKMKISLILILCYFYIAKCEVTFVECPSTIQFSTCSICVSDPPQCYCNILEFSLAGLCFSPQYPCLLTLLKPLINSTNSIINQWNPIVKPFWQSKIRQSINSSIYPISNKSQVYLNGLDFSTMDYQFRKIWTEGYYFYLVYKRLNLHVENLTQSDLIIKSINFGANLQGQSTLKKWVLITKFYNQTFNKQLNLNRLILNVFGPTMKQFLPCHGCMNMYGLLRANNTYICQKCSPGCILCNNNTSTCLSCLKGYYLDQKLNQCIECQIFGCEQCDSTTCLKCSQKYSLVNNKCILCKGSCTYCIDQNPNICTQCSHYEYSLQPDEFGQCHKCTQAQCQICDLLNSSVCINCASGYYNEESHCYPCSQQCSNCSSRQICYNCKRGYSMKDEKCVKCQIPGCLLCQFFNNQTICIVCYQQNFYISINGSCILNDSKNQDSIKCRPGCDLCYNNNTQLCFKCHERYYFDNKKCLKCMDGCLSCYHSPNYCLSCVSGYALTPQYICKLCPQNCRQCNPLNITHCLDCIVKYDLNEKGICQKVQNQYCFINNDDNSKCLICLYGFTSTENGKCISCSAGCNQTCNPYNITQCRQGRPLFSITNVVQFYFAQQGCDQSLNNGCLKPGEGYFLQIKNGSIIPARECLHPCLQCTQKYCLKCQESYTLSRGQCLLYLSCNQSCLICKAGSYRNQNTSLCELCKIQKCANCDSEKCIQCFEGYYLSNGTCNKCPEKCRTCYDSRNCKTCSTGYIWPTEFRTYSYDCIKCSDRCKSCKLQQNFCTSCSQGKQLINHRCFNKVANINFYYVLDYKYEDFLKEIRSKDFINNIRMMIQAEQQDIVIKQIKKSLNEKDKANISQANAKQPLAYLKEDQDIKSFTQIKGIINGQDQIKIDSYINLLTNRNLSNFHVVSSSFQLPNFKNNCNLFCENKNCCTAQAHDQACVVNVNECTPIQLKVSIIVLGTLLFVVVVFILVFIFIKRCKRCRREATTVKNDINPEPEKKSTEILPDGSIQSLARQKQQI